MMANFDVEKTTEVIANSKKIMNGAPLELAQKLSMVLKDAGDNELLVKALEQLKTFQDGFNDFTESLGGLLKEFEKVEEINEIIKKLDVGEVSAADTSFTSTEMDVDSIV